VPRSPVVRCVVAAGLLLVVGILLMAPGCSSPRPNRIPVGEVFPTVAGRSLEGDPVELPAAYAGAPVVLVVGYLQKTQFDIDRWILGLLQSGVDVRIVEVPTIPGLVPGLASGWIDEGMRSGIPPEDWGSVVTLYGRAADPVAAFTGTEGGRNGRVLLLDGEGRVAWFADEGYAPREMMELAAAIETLREPGAAGDGG